MVLQGVLRLLSHRGRVALLPSVHLPPPTSRSGAGFVWVVCGWGAAVPGTASHRIRSGHVGWVLVMPPKEKADFF